MTTRTYFRVDAPIPTIGEPGRSQARGLGSARALASLPVAYPSPGSSNAPCGRLLNPLRIYHTLSDANPNSALSYFGISDPRVSSTMDGCSHHSTPEAPN